MQVRIGDDIRMGRREKVELYLAPMEEITGYIFRNVTDRHFPGADRFITPFVSPNQKNLLKTKDGREVIPEHNAGKKVAIQILSNNAQETIELMQRLQEYGYNDIDFNFGCPSGTVTKKRRGSGILKEPALLDAFLGEIFGSEIAADMNISVKTRVGLDSDELWPEIVDIYNKYPISILTVHPRVGTDFYKGNIRKEPLEYALSHYSGRLCYNGDVVAAADVERLQNEYGEDAFAGIMIGRGAVANPGIFREIKTGQKMTLQELKEWHNDLFAEYEQTFSVNDALYKMKEVWFYLSHSFEGIDRPLKNIRKCNNKADYFAAVREVWRGEYCGIDNLKHW